MRVALFSTYPPTRCGIGLYTKYLRDALVQRGEAEISILAEHTSEPPDPADQVIQCWHRRKNFARSALAGIGQARPDLVHIQHEEALLGQDRRTLRLLLALRGRGIRSVITLHSVYGGGHGWLPGRLPAVPFQQSIGEIADRIVVHQHSGCRDRLLDQGIPAGKIRVIAHGTLHSEQPGRQQPSREQARAALGLDPQRPVALGLGFIHPKKGTHTLVRAFSRVARVVPGAQLVIAGASRRRNPLDLAYSKLVAQLMRPGLEAGWLEHRPGFQSSETVRNLLAAADVLLFAYRQSYGSASGILHTALGAGRPVLCSRGFKFAEAFEAWGEDLPELFPRPGDVDHWAAALIRVLSDAGLRAELSARAEALGRQTAWPEVARQHLELYRDALAPPGSRE